MTNIYSDLRIYSINIVLNHGVIGDSGLPPDDRVIDYFSCYTLPSCFTFIILKQPSAKLSPFLLGCRVPSVQTQTVPRTPIVIERETPVSIIIRDPFLFVIARKRDVFIVGLHLHFISEASGRTGENSSW